ncbi:unnamed protein product [Prorocentrum cordatum]|uniref:Uncharacterized protein n=1 Tax=Prorocentrum cordatum TaxID=2364126 RepID=A0ABN9XGR3_9DINO|nr:unnamed protein product [Polarella glacialis]
MQALQDLELPCLLGKAIQTTKVASNGNHCRHCWLDDDFNATGATTVCANTSDLTHAARGIRTDARRQALASRWLASQELAEAHPPFCPCCMAVENLAPGRRLRAPPRGRSRCCRSPPRSRGALGSLRSAQRGAALQPRSCRCEVRASAGRRARSGSSGARGHTLC